MQIKYMVVIKNDDFWWPHLADRINFYTEELFDSEQEAKDTIPVLTKEWKGEYEYEVLKVTLEAV